MNRKNTIIILGAFCLLIGSVHAFSLDSSSGIGHSGTSLLSHAGSSHVLSGPFIVEVEPKSPNSTVSSTKASSPSVGSSRGSGMSANELARVLGTSRVYDPTNRKWSKFSWTPIQRENIVMSWTYRGDKIGVKRPSAGRLYYNKME